MSIDGQGNSEGALPCFMVDHMLARLGAYLRAVGCDAAAHPTLRVQELIDRANREDRVFLTRRRVSAERGPVPRRGLRLRSDRPAEQLREVAQVFGLDLGVKLFTRCLRCNVELAAVADPAAVRDRVPPRVFAAQARFTVCPACGRIFWSGSHVRNTCRKLGLRLP